MLKACFLYRNERQLEIEIKTRAMVDWQLKMAIDDEMVTGEGADGEIVTEDGANGEIACVGMIILMVRCCVHQSMLCFLVPS